MTSLFLNKFGKGKIRFNANSKYKNPLSFNYFTQNFERNPGGKTNILSKRYKILKIFFQNKMMVKTNKMKTKITVKITM